VKPFFFLFNNLFNSKVHHNKEGNIFFYFQYVATLMVTLIILLVIVKNKYLKEKLFSLPSVEVISLINTFF